MLNLKKLGKWEKVEAVIRRHWIVFLMIWVYAFLGIGLIVILYLIFWFVLWINILNIIFFMFLVVFLYIEWINHELDMYVITNKRIIWIEQISFLNREVSECSLDDVQEVNSKTKWLLANLLNYWSLTIQTAWNASNFHMDLVPDSLFYARKVLNTVEKNKTTKTTL